MEEVFQEVMAASDVISPDHETILCVVRFRHPIWRRLKQDLVLHRSRRSSGHPVCESVCTLAQEGGGGGRGEGGRLGGLRRAALVDHRFGVVASIHCLGDELGDFM